MKIKVLYEDPNILAIEKPSGISVHPANAPVSDPRSIKKPIAKAQKEQFITDWVLKNYPKMKNVGEPMGEIARPGVVHRLDRDTSGVLLLAKNQKAHEFLKKQFMDRVVKKTYVAIVSGTVNPPVGREWGVINEPIGRSPKDFRRYLAGRGARGEMREAITEYKVIKNFSSGKNKYTYLELRPKTGRTHQIRVHMKFLNHPVVHDELYNKDGAYPKDIKRMALHAKSIEFQNLKGEKVKVESKIPKEFEKVVK